MPDQVPGVRVEPGRADHGRADRDRAPSAPSPAPVEAVRLVLAARLAGDVPLPLWVADDPAPDRFTERLAGTPVTLAHEELAEAWPARRDGPAGARASLADRGVVDGSGVLDPAVGATLQNLAGAPLSVVLDLTVVRRSGDCGCGRGSAYAVGWSPS